MMLALLKEVQFERDFMNTLAGNKRPHPKVTELVRLLMRFRSVLAARAVPIPLTGARCTSVWRGNSGTYPATILAINADLTLDLRYDDNDVDHAARLAGLVDVELNMRDLEAALTQLSEALPPTQGEDEHKAEAQENKSET